MLHFFRSTYKPLELGISQEVESLLIGEQNS